MFSRLRVFLQVGTDQQRLTGTNNVFGKAASILRERLGSSTSLLDFVFEADFIAFLKGHIKICSIENPPQFFLNSAEDFILIQM